MLFNTDKQEINYMPHQDQYDQCRASLSQDDYRSVLDAIHQYMESKDVFNASHIPGNEWTGTPYEPIYDACGRNFDVAKLFFGQLVWEAVMEHGDRWCFIRQESQNDRPIGMTYFRRED